MNKLTYAIDKWMCDHIGGHINFKLFGHECVWFGNNAMHFAIEIITERFGYICFHPPCWSCGEWRKWKFFLSPNATPWAATFAIGPGLSKDEKRMAHVRYGMFGHGYDTGEYEQPMNVLKDIYEQLELHRIRQMVEEGTV